MANWTESMQQTYEYYLVDPDTWGEKELLTNVKSATIERDSEAETLGSATIDITESVGECYIRIYLITIQNGIKERHPLGTYLVQTPSSSFDGRIRNVSMDAYTPLLELKENPPPIGFSIPKGSNVLQEAYRLTREHARAPVIKPTSVSDEKFILAYDFVANTDDTWLSFLTDLLSTVNYQFDLDEISRIRFSPKQESSALHPIWTYDDGNSSILYPDLNLDHDLYGIPNRVEVIYTGEDSNGNSIRIEAEPAVNDDPNSPTSTVSRGRPIVYRDTNPNLAGIPTKAQLDEYAILLLRNASTIEYSIGYTHGYCPVRVGDCVKLEYARANMTNIKAKVISQSIRCVAGCPVSEKAVYTTKLWG